MPDRTDGTLRPNNSARKHPIGFSSLTRNLERREEKQDFSLNFHENPEIFQATRLRMISQDGSTVTLRFRKFAMFAGNGSAGFSRQFSLSPPPSSPSRAETNLPEQFHARLPPASGSYFCKRMKMANVCFTLWTVSGVKREQWKYKGKRKRLHGW